MTNYLDKFKLSNKIAFITGGYGLLGSEIVKAFLDAEAKVVVLGLDKKKFTECASKKKFNKKKVFFEEFDISKLNQLDSNIDKLLHKYGKIDVWVNSAYPRTADWKDNVSNLKLKSWQENINNHLNAYSWISRKVCLIMQKQKTGSLINFASIYGLLGNDFTIYEGTNMTAPMAYSAIKGGIINLDRYLASYFGKDNVRINSLCPGGVFDNQNPIFVKNYSNKTPLKRMAAPSDIASAILFLASDASSYITGSTLMVDGGWSII